MKTALAEWSLGIESEYPVSGNRKGGIGAIIGVTGGVFSVVLAILQLLGAAMVARGAETGEEGGERFVMLIEPKLLAGEMFRLVPGAKSTGFVPGREVEYGGLEEYDRGSFETLGLTWEGFFARAQESADRLMATLEPEYVRDHREVIQYALVRSKSQRTASVILGAKFLEKFRKTIGNELVVVIPDRYSVYVFPKIGGDYAGYSEAMNERYEDAVYPVSLEVFEVTGKGVRAIGSLKTRERGIIE